MPASAVGIDQPYRDTSAQTGCVHRLKRRLERGRCPSSPTRSPPASTASTRENIAVPYGGTRQSASAPSYGLPGGEDRARLFALRIRFARVREIWRTCPIPPIRRASSISFTRSPLIARSVAAAVDLPSRPLGEDHPRSGDVRRSLPPDRPPPSARRRAEITPADELLFCGSFGSGIIFLTRPVDRSGKASAARPAIADAIRMSGAPVIGSRSRCAENAPSRTSP